MKSGIDPSVGENGSKGKLTTENGKTNVVGRFLYFEQNGIRQLAISTRSELKKKTKGFFQQIFRLYLNRRNRTESYR